MNRDVDHSRCPVVERESVSMVATMDGAEARKDFEILWLRESETKLVLMHRGVEICDLGTTNDFYGFLTSAEGAIEDAASHVVRLKIDDGTLLRVVALLRVFDEPRLASDADPFGAMTAYGFVPDSWRLDEWREEDGHRWRPRIAPRPAIGGDEGMEIWSSSGSTALDLEFWATAVQQWRKNPESISDDSEERTK